MEAGSHDRKTPNHGIDTHGNPPQHIWDMYKTYQKLSPGDIDDPCIIDLQKGLKGDQLQKLRLRGQIEASQIETACRRFEFGDQPYEGDLQTNYKACDIYEHSDFPGLQICSGLLPPSTQKILVSRLLHRDLANPIHKTNIYKDYHPLNPSTTAPPENRSEEPVNDQSSPQSFFQYPKPSIDAIWQPREPSKHKPLNMAQFMQRLRWLTIGTQYDWVTRIYPETVESEFPPDTRDLVRDLFPSVRTESGVVLLYSPKDYMPVHRDVSEESPNGIVSISLGCDGLFIMANDPATDENEVVGEQAQREPSSIVIRVHSGDVLYIAGQARFAWHAMPKVLSGTCPSWLLDWPVSSETTNVPVFWKGWMASKRINISCRQVYS